MCSVCHPVCFIACSKSIPTFISFDLPLMLHKQTDNTISDIINVEKHYGLVKYLSLRFIHFLFLSLIQFLFPLSPPDALLADLENTGSPLARCPVLLTSDPPQNADPPAQDPAQSRPPPPAYTPQQVDDQLPGMHS